MTRGHLDGQRILVLAENPCDPDPRIDRSAEALASAGASVRLLAWRRDSKAPTVEDRGGVQLERVPPAAGRQLGWRQFPNLLRFSWECWSRVKGERYDVVVAHDVLMLPLAARLAKRWSAALVYDAHEIYRWMEEGRLPSIWLTLVETIERRLVNRRVDAFVTVSRQRVETYWTENVRKEATVVGNWYNPRDIDRLAAREQLGLRVGAGPVIAYAGTLSPARRIDLLIELAKARPDVTVVIAGRGGPQMVQMVERATQAYGNIRFLGWIPDTLLLLGAADAVFYSLDPAHPYSRFAAPNTLYSAIAVNRPLLAVGQGEIEWMAANSEGVILLGGLSLEALEQAMERIPAWPGWGAVRSQFTWDESERRLVQATRESIRPGPRAD